MVFPQLLAFVVFVLLLLDFSMQQVSTAFTDCTTRAGGPIHLESMVSTFEHVLKNDWLILTACLHVHGLLIYDCVKQHMRAMQPYRTTSLHLQRLEVLLYADSSVSQMRFTVCSTITDRANCTKPRHPCSYVVIMNAPFSRSFRPVEEG